MATLSSLLHRKPAQPETVQELPRDPLITDCVGLWGELTNFLTGHIATVTRFVPVPASVINRLMGEAGKAIAASDPQFTRQVLRYVAARINTLLDADEARHATSEQTDA